MDLEQKLQARGAVCVAGDLILDRVVVGCYRHGNFLPTEQGQAEGLIDDEVEAEVERPARSRKPVRVVPDTTDAADAPLEADASTEADAPA